MRRRNLSRTWRKTSICCDSSPWARAGSGSDQRSPWAGGHGAGFASVITNRDHVVEGLPDELQDRFAPLPGDVHTGVGHDQDRPRVHTPGRSAVGAESLEPSPAEMPEPPLGHPGSAGVACVENEDAPGSRRFRCHADLESAASAWR